MNRPPDDEDRVKKKPSRLMVEPLRQYGIGPALLIAYVFILVILQFFLVSLGTISSVQSC